MNKEQICQDKRKTKRTQILMSIHSVYMEFLMNSPYKDNVIVVKKVFAFT